MRIEELIIDGFKSYAVRTIISGWDPEFNAITGLNGSGKSNILDAICFVLGITNLSQVRASNMQDLIYKRGQTGVNKASVTIVFNNEDRDNSPVGFEQYSRISITRQIILGGQSKYIVNGHRAQQNVVQNLFQSVQLNINNPHFLIMQGRITKVLNMKPPEILAMIEEAAGTRMFEERKEKALKTIAKKEKKLEEITELLKEEIGPKLDKLRTEKRSYLEFQKTESDIERLTRLVVAYEYTKHLEKLDRSGADHEAKKVKIQELLELNERLKDEITYLEEDIRQTTLNKEKEIGTGDKIQMLENNVTEYSNQIVRINTKCELTKTSITEERKNKDSLLSVKAEIEQNLSQKRKNYETLQAQFDQIKKNHDEKSEKVRKSDELLQTLSTGVSAQEGHENGYMEQLQEAKNNATQAKTELEQAKLKISHLEKELKEKEPQAQKAQKDGRGLLSTLESARKTAQDLHANLSRIDWDQSRMEDLLKKKLIEEKAIQDLTEKCESLSSQLSNLEFVYSKPTPDFDRNTVKGLVAELISLDPRFANCSTALEICAGGRLYNVVVDNEKIGSLLLEKGKLRKKITIIPLNKIQAFKLPAERIAAAQKLSPGKVNLALTLIGYDREVTPAMEYVFGGTLICADADSAKLVTFHKSVHAKSVTLEGDVYDPSGTLQGGSKSSSEGILNKMQTFRELKDKLKYHQQALDQLKFEIEDAQKIMHKYNQVKQQLDLKTHEIALLEEQVNKSSNSQIIHVVENIMSQIAEQENIIVASKEKYKACQITCQRLENEMKEFKNNRDSKLKEIQKSVAQGKAELSQSNQVVITMNRDVQILHLEIKQLEEDLQNSNKDIENSDKSIKQLMDIVASMETELSNLKSSLDNAQSELDNERNILSAFDEEIKELQAAIKTKTAQMTEVQLEISRINHELERFLKEKQTAQQAILQMEQNYDWIIQQKHHFGKPNTAYDFINNNPNECKKMLRQLEEKHNNMRKKINAKVMNMIDSVEKKEVSLNQMLATVLKDKKKIEDTIVSLDDYKKDALQKTWEKVNADFGAIFADLLPNSFAKLEPLEGRDLTHGLEVKVQLGGVWKQSLSELSGGQRSLIALSLILSLLQFKPAPMYILDEVDAALDLSHTQNIGQLLRTRFKGSQFIVVSLKDGMFNNANVLFRTRFRDGTSVVEVSTHSRA
ncbi:putative nuclear condensin complex subunit Smc2 [Gigaspora margarita]|uniref:Structural maintenance of chromosomes protein n=1 Tax=Gigaspora margarita TaxID=4874 RepID=A0A8H4AEE7_GIGMA|nr:putative nuclear condensin complex subunit Smc2 [Gigaspora margarita]